MSENRKEEIRKGAIRELFPDNAICPYASSEPYMMSAGAKYQMNLFERGAKWADDHSSLIEKLNRLPRIVTSLGKTGYLEITKGDGEYEGYWGIMYKDEKYSVLESRYDKTSSVYLCSYEVGFENAIDDMLDRLTK